ncbi:MAG: succinate dehydrogenase cytochrome b subunit [Verrucomicrobiota bacterium]
MTFFRAIAAFCSSSIGRKILVAVTGIALLLFLAGHLAGNLLIYVGPEAINAYAYKLHHMLHGSFIWIARGGLLACVGIHVYFTIQLVRENRAARDTAYAKPNTVQATKASRTMIMSGLVILAFVVYHILHFTAQVTPGVKATPMGGPEITAAYGLPDGAVVKDVYNMVITGFKNPVVSIFYIIAMGLLCTHLSHGFSSAFQTLGLRSKRTAKVIKGVGLAYAAIIFLGNISIPISVLTGVVK